MWTFHRPAMGSGALRGRGGTPRPPPRAQRPLEAQMAPVVSVRSSYPAAMPRNVDLLAVNWNPPSRRRPHRQHHKRTGARYRACLAPDIPVGRVFAPFGTSVRSPWAQTAHLQRHRASQSRRVPPPHEQAPQNQAPAAKCPESPSGGTMAANAEVMYCKINRAMLSPRRSGVGQLPCGVGQLP